jgi:integrase/recombinase XerD
MLSRTSEAVIAVSTFKVADCDTDEQLIALWLHGKSPHTRDAYQRDVRYFQAFCEGRPLPRMKLNDVVAFSDALTAQGYAVGTIRRRINAVKSLLKKVEVPKGESALAERILSESEVLKMIALEPCERNRVMLRFLYESGCRVSELINLKWKNLQDREGIGQVSILGKGSKRRVVLFSSALWSELRARCRSANSESPVFASVRSGGRLTRSNVWDIVTAAASRAGIQGKVSPHWLRHAHASHSLDRGAPVHLVQQTLGHASVATTSRYLHARPNDSSSLYLPR